MRRILLICSVVLTAFAFRAQADVVDSMQTRLDSLTRELQQMRLNEMMIQHALLESGRSAREDSLRKAEQKARIDSLRQITPGVPLVVGENDTLFYFYASLGGEDAMHRARSVSRRIERIGKSLELTSDSVHVFASEFTDDIMFGKLLIMRVSDLDGLWNGVGRHELAEEYRDVIARSIYNLQEEYGLKAKLKGIGWAVFLIVVQIIFFMITARFIRHLRKKIIGASGDGKLHPWVINDYELLNMQQVKRILLMLTRLLQVLLVILQLTISLPLFFSIFPETEQITWKMISYVSSPLQDIGFGLISYIPNLVKIFITIYLVRWILRGTRHITDEIASGRLKIDKFYEDWAQPTYQIVRILIVAFTLVVIWPWLPGSESGIFQGVSIFVAALFSLGSTTTIGNLISGIIITYMRPFLVGDYVRIGDREGVVVEKNAFITRLRDIKENIITVPNNSILSQQTVNYTAAARHRGGTIVHSDFTFTYKVPRKIVEQYLLEGADRCKLLLKEPKPFVLVTALEDFYTHYEINGYTKEAERLFEVYSELHKNIVDVFSEHDLDPTSSHFVKVETIN